METIKVNTSQHVDIDYPVAGLGERIAARLIDLAAFFGVYMSAIFLSFFVGQGNFITVVLVTMAAFYVFYNLICEVFMNGQSLGKRLMKIKVISIDGSQASIGQYFIRWLFRLVDFALTAQIGGLIAVAVSEKKQRIGDMVAGTTLIKTVPRTNLEHIAFHPVEEEYTPVFKNADLLTDRDIELMHEVVLTYYKTSNADLIYNMSAKVAEHLSVSIPQGMNELNFLTTVIKDYNHLTAQSD
ncbi:RDD family protein [Pedobacter sp. KBW06]|uniref:RDD family protein n=1 Tax=Pedobacter sp. KBW06 TaxID=2153359 RepID=UPI000F59B49A|nr:RDD family protein [Pedobacter sp. KBW06]RQO72358.1 RDD family protein [Pedobacter sp. KBW06]